jgi:hypothetical protein
MSKLTGLKHRAGIIGEFFGFLWRMKLWWLIPLFALVFTFGLLLVASQGSALAPFIYTIF